uniref:Laminin G domain-containing protein n=1 Tax=Romanomermis culicivorax TaxID=13658 RepID=A0A915JLW9_ROMCU
FVTKQSFYGCIDNLKLSDQVVNLADYKSAAFVEIGCPEKAVRVVSFDESGGGMEFSRVDLGQSFEITFKFKTKQRDALIWLVTDDKNDKMLVVTLESGRIVLSSIENRATVFRLKLASRDLSDGAWHYITAIGKEKSVQLDFDDIYTESGEATDPIPLPNVEPTLFFGKVPIATLTAMNGNVASRIGPFVGCVGDFTINTRLLDFSNATRSAAGVSYVGCPMADPSDGIGSDADNVTTLLENTAETLEQRKITAPPPPDGCVAYIPGKVEDLAGTRFGLNPFSRLEFDQLPDAFDTKAEFSIQFRATASSGVLIYAGNRIQNDYVTLYMKNGYLFFSFDSGTGPFTLQSKRPYLDFQWHTVVAMRDNRYANLTLNGIVEAEGESPGETYAIDTHKPIFVGGLSNDYYPMAKKNLVGVTTSFGGCLRDFRLNGHELTDASSSHGTRPCTDTVENGLFFGPAGGYAILQEKLNVGPTFSFEMEMKPLVKNAVILSIASDSSSGGDYLTLQLLDGVLKFAVDNGAGQQTVNTSLPQSEAVCDGHWHSVKIYKTKNILTISLDGSNKFHVIKQVKSTVTNTDNPLYLGGIPQEHMNRGLDTRENFRGCIRDVNIGRKPRRKKHLDVSQVNVHGNVLREGCPLH